MKLHITKPSDMPLPAYSRAGDAAIDLRSQENMLLPAGGKVILNTGVRVAIPEGHVGLLWQRGGLAAKHELEVLGGVIDSNYRGEIQVVLKNLSNNDFHVERNMRIAQMLIQPVVVPEIVEVDSLDDTERGENRFSSSGLL